MYHVVSRHKNPTSYVLNPHSYFVVALNHKRKDESVLPHVLYVITLQSLYAPYYSVNMLQMLNLPKLGQSFCK